MTIGGVRWEKKSRSQCGGANARYSKEFKLAAVKLLQSGAKPGTLIAMELGIQRNLLYKWAEMLKTAWRQRRDRISGPGATSWEATAIRSKPRFARLKRELARVTEERDILKKKPRRILRRCASEVRLHPATQGTGTAAIVKQGAARLAQWLLRLARSRTQRTAHKRTMSCWRKSAPPMPGTAPAYGALKTWRH